MTKLIILDRDGVINFDSPNFIKSVDEWIPIPGSLEAIADLNMAGFTMVIATNQSGLARKYFTPETLEAIHDKMQTLLAALSGKIDGIYFCPHGPDDNCPCRKPKPGLIKQILKDFNIPPNNTFGIWVIGDSLRDLEAAYAADCTPVLVKTGHGTEIFEKLPDHLKNIQVFENLDMAAKYLIQHYTPISTETSCISQQ